MRTPERFRATVSTMSPVSTKHEKSWLANQDIVYLDSSVWWRHSPETPRSMRFTESEAVWQWHRLDP